MSGVLRDNQSTVLTASRRSNSWRARASAVVAIVLLWLGACATTQLTASWKDPAFSGPPLKQLLVIGASPGGFGTIMAQNHWLPVLRTLGARHWSGGRLMVSRAQSVFGADGALQDESVRRLLAEFVHGFALFVADSKGEASST